MKMNVVIVASELPYPPTAGNRIRTLNLALRLAPRHRITFIAHRNDDTAEASRFLHEHGIEAILVRPGHTGEVRSPLLRTIGGQPRLSCALFRRFP